MEFNGKKFYCDHTEMVKNTEVWWEDEWMEKKHFVPTRAYREYLRQKRERERKEEIIALKDQLKAQYEKEGEVDEWKFQRLMALIKA